MKNMLKWLLTVMILMIGNAYAAAAEGRVAIPMQAQLDDKEQMIELLKERLKQLMNPLFIVLHADYDLRARRNLRAMIERTIANVGQGGITPGAPRIKIDRILREVIKKPLEENDLTRVLRLVHQGELLEARKVVRAARGLRTSHKDFSMQEFLDQYSDILARIMYEGLLGAGRPYAFILAPVKRSAPIRPRGEEEFDIS